VRRINVSLDTLDAAKFAADHPLGPPAAGAGRDRGRQAAGLRVKINAVALKGFNEDELFPLLTGAPAEGHDLTFIEVMPMGDMGEDQRGLTSTGR
jgi:cyclic pyranopterin phosphate synthase